jgi:hypothetical protein
MAGIENTANAKVRMANMERKFTLFACATLIHSYVYNVSKVTVCIYMLVLFSRGKEGEIFIFVTVEWVYNSFWLSITDFNF